VTESATSEISTKLSQEEIKSEKDTNVTENFFLLILERAVIHFLDRLNKSCKSQQIIDKTKDSSNDHKKLSINHILENKFINYAQTALGCPTAPKTPKISKGEEN